MSTKPVLERAEWDLDELTKGEDRYTFIKCCHDYEFARELTDVVKEAIVSWRKDATKTDFEGLLDHSWRIGKIGWIRNFFPFPEWPTSPIGSIDRTILSDRVKKLGYWIPYKEWSDEALAAVIDPKMAIWNTPRTLVELSIPEICTREELRLFFDAYLKEHFPAQCKPRPRVIGGGSPARQMKSNLKYLGAWRLLTRMTAKEAADYTNNKRGRPLYPAHSNKWSKARIRADRVINDFRKAAQAFT